MRVDEEESSPSSFDSEEEEDDDYISEEDLKTDRWIDHYSSSHKMLLVGEGDFSFSLSLAKAFDSARNIIATSIDTQPEDLVKKYGNGIRNVREIEERGGIVLCGIDAKTMSQHFFLKTQRFDRIIYNFPHVGFVFPEGNGCQIKLNKRLVKGFLKNAKVLLKKDNNKGEIHVSHKDGDPYDKWDLVKKAEKIGLILKETVPFCREKYPGYDNKRADGKFSDAAFRLGDSTTFKFTHAKNNLY